MGTIRQMEWRREDADELAARAAQVLAKGKLVAIPTETVYGLAADATNGRGVAGIFAAKGRPRFNPLICHVDSLEMASALGQFSDRALLLAERFWPGGLTLVVKQRDRSGQTLNVHPLVTAGLDTIALRLPIGPANAIIRSLGRPVAAPSANKSGRLTATQASHVVDQLGSSVELLIDAGPTRIGLESTIVALGDGPPRLLRAGAIPAADIEAVLGEELSRPGADDPIDAPGMLASHYAPRADLRLNAIDFEPDEAALLFGPTGPGGLAANAPSLSLSPSGDLVEAAANLFTCLAELDAGGAHRIAVSPIPETGLGEAINDRLRRAAAPRPTGTDAH